MKSRLRLALPPLAQFSPATPLPFALFDREGRLLRAAQLPLRDMAQAGLPLDNVQVILAPGDAIVTTVVVPPVNSRQLHAAVLGSIEPMALSDPEDLCVAHGPRDASGQVAVAWTARQPLLQAWKQLSDAGLRISAIVPHALAIPPSDPHPDQPLALPADARWQAPLPRWSLARQELRPASGIQRWRGALLWCAAAALLWIIGLQIHAAQLRGQAQALQQSMEQSLRKAFPEIPVIIDPVRQAQAQRNALRLAHGASADDDFIPLAMAAAVTLEFAANYVGSLRYRNGELLLTLREGYSPPGNEAALRQTAATHGLIVEKDDKVAHTWHIRRATPAESGARP